ncbi:hypothetical protein I4U23_001122 [Adineta vaga]|nr:hypothetical protein I4U23_001122 [Adineta vaga]
MERSSIILIGIISAIILLLLFPIKNHTTWSTDNEDAETSISLCQIHVQSDESNLFDDQILLALLATFKMHDFQIGQPVWGPSNTRLYLCEHPLKAGLKQSTIDNDLNSIIRNGGDASKRFAWSCA